MAGQTGVYRGVSASDRIAERRSRLLDAALTVWADPDVRTTMTAICAEAGLSERYFYESFANLDAILAAVMDDVAREIEDRCRAAADAAEDDPAARVEASLRAFVGLLEEDPRKGRVAIVESVAVASLRERRTALLRYLAHQAALDARELLGTGAHTDVADPADEAAGLLFIGGMAELVTAWLDGTYRASADDIVEAAARAFLGLYG